MICLIWLGKQLSQVYRHMFYSSFLVVKFFLKDQKSVLSKSTCHTSVPAWTYSISASWCPSGLSSWHLNWATGFPHWDAGYCSCCLHFHYIVDYLYGIYWLSFYLLWTLYFRSRTCSLFSIFGLLRICVFI